MKVRLILTRHQTARFTEDDFTMETECKTVVVDLPIENDRNKYFNAGLWQVVGYEEVKDEASV
jgi:hypothetical protein